MNTIQRYAQRLAGDHYKKKAMATQKSAYIIRLSLFLKKTQGIHPTGKVRLTDSLRRSYQPSGWLIIGHLLPNRVFPAWALMRGKTVLNAGEPLDGGETEVRSRSTNLCRLIVQAMKQAAPWLTW